MLFADGASVDVGLQLDGAGRLSLRVPGEARPREHRLTPEVRAAVRDLLIHAVDRGELVPDAELPALLARPPTYDLAR